MLVDRVPRGFERIADAAAAVSAPRLPLLLGVVQEAQMVVPPEGQDHVGVAAAAQVIEQGSGCRRSGPEDPVEASCLLERQGPAFLEVPGLHSGRQDQIDPGEPAACGPKSRGPDNRGGQSAGIQLCARDGAHHVADRDVGHALVVGLRALPVAVEALQPAVDAGDAASFGIREEPAEMPSPENDEGRSPDGGADVGDAGVRAHVERGPFEDRGDLPQREIAAEDPGPRSRGRRDGAFDRLLVGSADQEQLASLLLLQAFQERGVVLGSPILQGGRPPLCARKHDAEPLEAEVLDQVCSEGPVLVAQWGFDRHGRVVGAEQRADLVVPVQLVADDGKVDGQQRRIVPGRLPGQRRGDVGMVAPDAELDPSRQHPNQFLR